MERLTESNLLKNGEQDPRSSGWLADNVLHPFVNGTGVVQIYNNFAKEKVQPAYVAPAETLSTNWAVHSLSSAAGAVLTYALVGKATGAGLGYVGTKFGVEGTAAKILASQATANIVGAGLFDLAKSPNPGETRIGNAVGSMAAFGAFSIGNGLIGQSKAVAENAIYNGLGRVAVGAAGGLTGLEVGHFVNKQLGAHNESLTWDDRFKAMAQGGFVNFAMPPMQKAISNVAEAAANRNPFRFSTSAETEAKLMDLAIEGKIGPQDLKTLVQRTEAKQFVQRAVGEQPPQSAFEANGELPTVILLKQQFDPVKRQAQMEMVAGELGRFMDGAKKSLHTAVYDFRISDPKVEKIVLDAINGRAENGVDVKLAFFKPAERPDAAGKGYVGGVPEGLEPLGPTPEFLAKLSPKVKTQALTLKEGAATKGAEVIPDPFGEVLNPSKSPGVNGAGEAPKVIDVQKGNTTGLGPDMEYAGITGGGKLMHHKYIVRDAGTPQAAIWTGSTNLTGSAFGNQDNNIIQFKSPKLADAYQRNFNELWESGTLKGTGVNSAETIKIGPSTVTVAFSPGEGKFIDSQVATQIRGMDNVNIASMVISSQQILQALSDHIDAGKPIQGIYDGPQMSNIARAWRNSKNPLSAEKLQLWENVKPHLVRKNSHPYSPEGPHDYMHNKTVTDGKTVITGSFNLSTNATMNAENVLIIQNPTVATQYKDYIGDLVKTYGKKAVGGN